MVVSMAFTIQTMADGRANGGIAAMVDGEACRYHVVSIGDELVERRFESSHPAEKVNDSRYERFTVAA